MYTIDVLELNSEGNAVLLPVKIVPGSSRTRYAGVWDGRARISVSAPPEKGQANRALATFLARLLGVRKRDVTIVEGHTSAIKVIRIERVTAEKVREVLRAD